MAKFVVARFSHHTGALTVEQVEGESELAVMRSIYENEFHPNFVPNATISDIQGIYFDCDEVIEILRLQ